MPFDKRCGRQRRAIGPRRQKSASDAWEGVPSAARRKRNAFSRGGGEFPCV